MLELNEITVYRMILYYNFNMLNCIGVSKYHTVTEQYNAFLAIRRIHSFQGTFLVDASMVWNSFIAIFLLTYPRLI